MLNHASKHKTAEELQQEVDELRYQLQVAEDTIEAIRTGSVDALAVQENGVTKIFTLEGAEETYRVLVENMGEGAVTLNQHGLILYCNSQFAKFVNLSLSEVIGSPFQRFLPTDYQESFQTIFALGWKQHVKSEFVLKPIQQDLLHVYISLTTIATKGDEVLGIIITNLSEQKELERLTLTKRELSKKNEELIRINDDLDTFVYTASHDLKNPVLNIEGLVTILEEVLEGDASSEEVKQIISHISSSVTRFKTTILDLTEISKVQKNFSSTPEAIDCQQIIKEVKEGLGEIISTSNAEVIVSISDCHGLQFSKKNFKSIVYNLLSNAIKYRSPDRKPIIYVNLENKDNYIVLSVRDNGLGINLKNESKLFAMFKRYHDHVEGSGIGLYIVKRIMDNADGKISVDSEIGKGSTFTLYFKVFEEAKSY
ncbi:ATP-binding protein [Pontibacter toksunensis]|uniref:histidine kinase n=1 Tax=Pontibacter toksunensis TaxID=1332631 RepID=A0ABW6BZE3_9BACT